MKDQEIIKYQGVPQAVYFYLEKIIEGCTDAQAENYNPEANDNDNSCVYSTQ